MWLEDFTPVESAESWSSSAEVSEKFKEAIKKWSAGIKRVQKDEKKAKKYDMILANFLVEIVRDGRFDILFEDIFTNISKWVSSKFILGVLSLIYSPISDKIRELAWKEKINFDFYMQERSIFSDDSIPEPVKNRINFWVEDISFSISLEPSTIVSHSLRSFLKKDEDLIIFSSKVFQFFLDKINIDIKDSKSLSYAEFIMKDIVLVKIESEDFQKKLEEV